MTADRIANYKSCSLNFTAPRYRDIAPSTSQRDHFSTQNVGSSIISNSRRLLNRLPFRQRAIQDSERSQHDYHEKRDSEHHVYHDQMHQREYVQTIFTMRVRCVVSGLVLRPFDAEYPEISCDKAKQKTEN